MRLGENNRNLTAEEQKAGQKAARSISRNLKNILGTEFQLSNPSLMHGASGASAKMKFDALDRIVVRTSSVGFIQHYGFEGIKKNGASMKLQAKNHLNKILDHTRALETLATEVADIRGEEITAKIKF